MKSGTDSSESFSRGNVLAMDRETLIRSVTEEVLRQIRSSGDGSALLSSPSSTAGEYGLQRDSDGFPTVVCNVSNRHLHLSQTDLETLFGKGHLLTRQKDLIQPGEFACEEIVTVATQRGRCTERVRVLGPVRPQTQLEISRSDAYFLGLRVPVRLSGDLSDAAGCTLIGPAGTVILRSGVIVAMRHLHCPVETARQLGLADGQTVSVRAVSPAKPTLYEGVVVRARSKALLELHLDLDDANASGIMSGDRLQLLL